VHNGILHDLKVRLAMSFQNKTIAVSAAALLAVAGGLYAFMSNDQNSGADGHDTEALVQTIAKPEATGSQTTPVIQSVEQTDAQGANPTLVQQPAAPDQVAAQAPKKLTKQQLTPPPATEEEKLQKAAERESNF
jgi:hypothetical protein